MKKLKSIGLLVLGFALYPLVFVPVCAKFFPGFLEWFIVNYAEYLRLWGI